MEDLKGSVLSLNISEKKGVVKTPVPRFVLDERGIVGDAHAGLWHRQVSLLAQEQVDAFMTKAKREIAPGEFAENITLAGLDLGDAAVLDRIHVGEAELEVSQIGKTCHGSGCAIYNEVGACVMPKEGIFGRVLRGGEVSAGDELTLVRRPFRVHVITLSDRAAAGEYSDRSGPRCRDRLGEFFAGKRWHLALEDTLMPDDAPRLIETLRGLVDGGCDVVFTLGGTGLGPRDIAPEAVRALAERELPGIMEHVRLKYGAEKPSALLSRSVAALAGRTLIYALPGSVRAVEEYLTEILPTLEHSVYMIHGLDTH